VRTFKVEVHVSGALDIDEALAIVKEGISIACLRGNSFYLDRVFTEILTGRGELRLQSREGKNKEVGIILLKKQRG
jgi:hypothetical protein